MVDPANTTPAPGTDPLAVAVADVARNPRNPRRPNPDVSDLESITEKQLQPARGVSREAYLRLYPGDEEQIGDAKVVAILGNRRHFACEKFGVEKIDIVVDDEMAKDRATLRAWALRENIDRQNLDIIEEAEALKAQAEELGSQAKAARSIGRSEGFVSQRLSLLKLDPDLQEKVRAGELAIERARELAIIPTEDQVRLWQEIEVAKQLAKIKGETPPAPKPPKQPVGIPAMARTIKKWNAQPESLAAALSEMDRGKLEQLVAKLNEHLSTPQG
ncbi:peptide transporter [Nocardia sp. NPDC051832]|uniref:ParB/RepB/Spo0J family partition protein n=1 Tax=Nocardia sp. NPDC051832 TaxID=3155673 RepID=UPI0034127DC2